MDFQLKSRQIRVCCLSLEQPEITEGCWWLEWPEKCDPGTAQLAVDQTLDGKWVEGPEWIDRTAPLSSTPPVDQYTKYNSMLFPLIFKIFIFHKDIYTDTCRDTLMQHIHTEIHMHMSIQGSIDTTYTHRDTHAYEHSGQYA